MAEYLHPGVYVVEIAGGVHPIEGVATSIDEATRAVLSRAIADVVRQHVPDWTEAPSHDPGTTLLQLFAFLGELLLYRANSIPPRSEHLAAVTAVALSQFRTSLEPSGPLRDVRFFSGRMLHASDFTVEQNPRRELRRYIKLLHGCGIVEGLDVALMDDGTSPDVTVRASAGLAIAPSGALIELADAVEVTSPRTDDEAFVVLHEAQSRHDPCLPRAQVAIVRAPASEGVTLARLATVDGRWGVDAAFVPARARR